MASHPSENSLDAQGQNKNFEEVLAGVMARQEDRATSDDAPPDVQGQPQTDEPSLGRFEEKLAMVRPPNKDGVLDWKGLCDAMNESAAIYRERVPSPTRIHSDKNL